MKYPLHPLCKAFPKYSDKELRELADDIKANGQKEPVVLLEDQVLDGQNRQAACELAGETCQYVVYSEDNPAAFVISKNLKRRSLSATKRAMIAARIAKWKLGQNQHTEGGSAPGPTQTEAAEQVDASPRSTRRAAKVIKKSEKLATMVEEEKLGLKDAETLAALPDKKLNTLLEKKQAEIRAKVKSIHKRAEEKREKDQAAKRKPTGHCGNSPIVHPPQPRAMAAPPTPPRADFNPYDNKPAPPRHPKPEAKPNPPPKAEDIQGAMTANQIPRTETPKKGGTMSKTEREEFDRVRLTFRKLMDEVWERRKVEWQGEQLATPREVFETLREDCCGGAK